MNFQWILLACFLVTLISEIAKAITRPMIKNVLNLISIPVAFIITFIIQICGLFQLLAEMAVDALGLASQLAGFEDIVELLTAFCTTLLSPLLFLLVFYLLLFLLRVIHVNLLVKFFQNKEEKMLKKELKLSIKEEKKRVTDAVRDNEEKTRELIEALSKGNDEKAIEEVVEDTYKTPDDDEIEDMVEKRIKKEKKDLKKLGFFKESKERKTISIVASVVSAFLIFAIASMPVFYTMSVLSSMTDGIKNTEKQDTKVYRIIDFVDEHFVTPYEESFVVQLYDSMALVDLMNFTTRAGGKVVMQDGTVVYADDVMKNVLSNGMKIVVQLTSSDPDSQKIADGFKKLTTDPFVLSTLTTLVLMALEDVEAPEDIESDDMMTNIKNKFITHYKNANKDIIAEDLAAVSDAIGVIVDSGLIQVLMGGGDMEALLQDREMLGNILASISGLTVYAPVMSETFTAAVPMLGEMLTIPADDQAAYDAVINQIVTAYQGIGEVSAEDIQAVKDFFKDSSSSADLGEYTKVPELDPEPDTTGMTEEEKAAKIEEWKNANQPKIDEFSDRMESLAPFFAYFMHWMNAQKPFMLAGEDDSSAPMAFWIPNDEGVLELYVCNTDDLTLEEIIDFMTSLDDSNGDSAETASDESTDDPATDSSTDLENPYSEFLSQLKVTKVTEENKAEFEGRVSPLTDLVNYLIANASAIADADSLDTVLSAYDDPSTTGEERSDAEKLVDKLLIANKDAFVYNGITIEKMQSSLHFGDENDEWTAEERAQDSKALVNIVFTFLDMMESATSEAGSGESEGAADGTGDSTDADISEMLGLLTTLGETMDLMSQTTCLNELPKCMIEGLLTNPMLSMIMTPSLMHEFDADLESIEKGELTYAQFMENLAETVTGLLDKVQGMGGEEQ